MKRRSSKKIRVPEQRVPVPAQPIDRSILDFQVLGKSEGLIELFTPLLQQYTKLLHWQSIDYSNRQIRYFLSYFIGDKELRRQLRGNIFVSQACRDEAVRITRMLHRNFPYEYEDETFNELTVVLLKMAKDYTEEGSGFNGFVHTYYSRYLKSYLMSDEMKNARLDPLLFATSYSFFEDNQDIYIHDTIFEDEYFSLKDEDDNLQWLRFVNEATDTNFEQLTIYQRIILIRYYIDHKTDSEIAKELAMHPGSVQRSRRKLYKQLWEKLQEGALKCSRLNMIPVSSDSFSNQRRADALSVAEKTSPSSDEVTH